MNEKLKNHLNTNDKHRKSIKKNEKKHSTLIFLDKNFNLNEYEKKRKEKDDKILKIIKPVYHPIMSFLNRFENNILLALLLMIGIYNFLPKTNISIFFSCLIAIIVIIIKNIINKNIFNSTIYVIYKDKIVEEKYYIKKKKYTLKYMELKDIRIENEFKNTLTGLTNINYLPKKTNILDFSKRKISIPNIKNNEKDIHEIIEYIDRSILLKMANKK